jgi:2-octaprenyl-6-methoxyphenol hydroxylase
VLTIPHIDRDDKLKSLAGACPATGADAANAGWVELAKPVLGPMAPSVMAHEVLGVWSHRHDYAAPLQVMRVADDDEHRDRRRKKPADVLRPEYHALRSYLLPVNDTMTNQSEPDRSSSPRPSAQTTSAAVIGGGPAGLVAALALAHFGVPTALVAPQPSRIDNRTTALMAPSVKALEALGVWSRCRDHAAPLRVMRIADDTGRLWRAPEVRFEAAEIGLEAFAWNIENAHLVAALWDRIAAMLSLTHVATVAQSVRVDDAGVAAALADGTTLNCQLAVGADGRNSICRTAAGIALDSRTYPQTALTFTLSHTRPHHDISTEFHTAQGPFTLVPLPGARSSLVCVVAADEAQRLCALTGAALDAEIERRSHSVLGKTRVEPGHGVFPMSVVTARSFAANRIALVGEAAHLFPPIGAQGLNLGLRDAVTIAEIAGDIHRCGGDIGDAMAAYDRRRRPDITSRTVAVDLLNRSLLSDFLAVQGVRGLGLYVLDSIGPLRRAAMREGVAPRAGMPALMRGEANV